jgi:hypothetical protein
LLKKNYNNEKELIAIAEKLNEMIRKLNVNW